MKTHWNKLAPAVLAAAMALAAGGCEGDATDRGLAASPRRAAFDTTLDVSEAQSAQRGSECRPCAPGDVPLTDGDGNSAGWCALRSDPARVQVDVLDVDLAASKAVISLNLDYARPPSSLTGLFRPLLIDFVQVCDDAQTVTMIEIAQEGISNNTGADWNTFDWILMPFGSTAVATFDVAASGGYDVSPFASSSFADFADAPANQESLRLRATSGIVSAGGSFDPGAGATPEGGGILKVNVSLASGNAVSWVLKQIPGHLTLLADVDGDGDVDSTDYSIVTGCLAGPGVQPSTGCDLADLDGDGDVDLVDVSHFNSIWGE